MSVIESGVRPLRGSCWDGLYTPHLTGTRWKARLGQNERLRRDKMQEPSKLSAAAARFHLFRGCLFAA